jgi:tungstate transport system ATP-binding protein
MDNGRERENILISGVKKAYGGREALNIERFALEPGKRYALLGANGAGKSTFLGILAGLLQPDEGSVRYNFEYRPADIGYLPQKPYPFALKVEKSVLLGIPGAQRSAGLAGEALSRVGLSGFENQRGDRLSGGEAQRVAIARMLLRPRRLLLLDEPCAAADIAATEIIEAAITEFCGRTGCTLVFSTHSPAQALRLADKAVFLHNGRIGESGDAKKVVTGPSNENAKAFLRSWAI